MSPNPLFQKIARIIGKVGRVQKNGRNDHHGYDYVTEADLVEAVRGLLAEEGVAFFYSVKSVGVREIMVPGYKPEDPARPAKAGPITEVIVEATFADGESGQTFSVQGVGAGQDAGDKGVYKALTGAQKYILMKTFLVATGDDPEADVKADRANAEDRGQAGRGTGDDAPPARPKAHQPDVKVTGQEAKPSEDPMQRLIPGGAFKGRTVGSLDLEEARAFTAKMPEGNAWRTLGQQRVTTLEELGKMPAAFTKANDDLDLEFDRKLAAEEK